MQSITHTIHVVVFNGQRLPHTVHNCVAVYETVSASTRHADSLVAVCRKRKSKFATESVLSIIGAYRPKEKLPLLEQTILFQFIDELYHCNFATRGYDNLHGRRQSLLTLGRAHG